MSIMVNHAPVEQRLAQQPVPDAVPLLSLSAQAKSNYFQQPEAQTHYDGFFGGSWRVSKHATTQTSLTLEVTQLPQKLEDQVNFFVMLLSHLADHAKYHHPSAEHPFIVRGKHHEGLPALREAFAELWRHSTAGLSVRVTQQGLPAHYRNGFFSRPDSKHQAIPSNTISYVNS